MDPQILELLKKYFGDKSGNLSTTGNLIGGGLLGAAGGGDSGGLGKKALSMGIDAAALGLAPMTGGLSLIATMLPSLLGGGSKRPSNAAQPVNPPRPTQLKLPSVEAPPSVSRKKSQLDGGDDQVRQLLQLILQRRGMMS